MKAFVYTQTDALRRYLGVEGKEPLPEGVYVSKAFKKFPLYEAGVRAGDMLHSFNNHALDNFGHARVPWNPDSRVTLSDLMSRVTYDRYIHQSPHSAASNDQTREIVAEFAVVVMASVF